MIKQMTRWFLISLVVLLGLGLTARPETLPTQWSFLRGLGLYSYR